MVKNMSNMRNLVETQNKNVDAFALDLATIIKKHLRLGTISVDDFSNKRFYEDQPTIRPLAVDKKEEKHTVLMFPVSRSQKKYTVPANSSIVIDFYEGTVLVDVSDSTPISLNLSKSLKSLGHENLKSIFVKTDGDVNIEINELGTRQINGSFTLRSVCVKRITLSSPTGAAFGFNVIGSTYRGADFTDSTSL